MRGRTQRPNKQSKVYQYYEDGGFHRKGKEVCTNIYLPRKALDEFALNKIAEKLQHPLWIEKIESNLREKHGGSSNFEQIQTIEKQ